MKKFLFFFLLCHIEYSWSQNFVINNIVINEPWIKNIHPDQKVTSGYLEIKNNGKSDDVLLTIESDFANKNQIHFMDIENDVMKMKYLKSGLIIKKNSKFVLEPGGYHLMFSDVNDEFKNKKYLNVKLNFKRNGSIKIPFQIKNNKKGHVSHKN